jgi:hypothetical protein
MTARMSTILGAVILFWLVVCLVGVEEPAYANERNAPEDEGGISVSAVSLVRPLGICALSLLLLTFLTGLFRRRLGRRFLKIHKILAFLTIAVALCHGVLVLLLF